MRSGRTTTMVARLASVHGAAGVLLGATLVSIAPACDLAPETSVPEGEIRVLRMGFVHGDGTDSPPVTERAVGVPLTTEVRLSFDGWLDPESIGPDSIVLRSGEVSRATHLRWDFQVGPRFPATRDDEPPHQVVAIRPYSTLERNLRYRVLVTEELRGLFGEAVVPFEATFTTGESEGGDLPEEPPREEDVPGVAPFVEGDSWNHATGPGDPRAHASCGWPSGPCHRVLDEGADYGMELPEDSRASAAMDLVMCEFPDANGDGRSEGCRATFARDPPDRDVYDSSQQWQGMRIVEPGWPDRSYLVFKLLGIPGLEGGPMPRDPASSTREPFHALNPLTPDEDDSFENRSNFVGIAQAFRRWIAAGAPPR